MQNTNNQEMVNHPSHYNIGKIEVIKVFYDWKLDGAMSSAVKYMARAGHKSADKTVEDLKKAIFYINSEIDWIQEGNDYVVDLFLYQPKYQCVEVGTDWKLPNNLLFALHCIYDFLFFGLTREDRVNSLQRAISYIEAQIKVLEENN